MQCLWVHKECRCYIRVLSMKIKDVLECKKKNPQGSRQTGSAQALYPTPTASYSGKGH